MPNTLKNHMIVAGLKAGLAHLAMTSAVERSNSEKDTWLCYAIARGQAAGKCTEMEANAARDHIMSMLGNDNSFFGYSTVREYLRDGLKVPAKLLNVKNVQLFRKRWAEHMIKEFS